MRHGRRSGEEGVGFREAQKVDSLDPHMVGNSGCWGNSGVRNGRCQLGVEGKTLDSGQVELKELIPVRHFQKRCTSRFESKVCARGSRKESDDTLLEVLLCLFFLLLPQRISGRFGNRKSESCSGRKRGLRSLRV